MQYTPLRSKKTGAKVVVQLDSAAISAYVSSMHIDAIHCGHTMRKEAIAADAEVKEREETVPV